MVGGLGDDTYYVDVSSDQTTENLNGGRDRVYTGVSGYTLAANVEELVLTAEADQSASGNELANAIYGNDYANAVYGAAGDDLLVGQGGNDFLQGGLGNDVLVGGEGFDNYNIWLSTSDPSFGQDLIRNDAFDDAPDVISMLGLNYDQLWFTHAAGTDNLVVSRIGTTDQITVADWYVSDQYHVEQFAVVTNLGSTAHYLDHLNVESLVSAMAGLTPPPIGQTTLTTAQSQALQGALSVWATTEPYPFA